MEQIYGRYGDQTFWGRILDQIYNKLTSHNELQHFFEGKDINHIKSMHVMLLSTALQTQEGHFPVSIQRVHKSLHISSHIFSLYESIYERVLKENGISKQDRKSIMSIIHSFKCDLVES
jgi:truncated hemoglobin YjbI